MWHDKGNCVNRWRQSNDHNSNTHPTTTVHTGRNVWKTPQDWISWSRNKQTDVLALSIPCPALMLLSGWKASSHLCCTTQFLTTSLPQHNPKCQTTQKSRYRLSFTHTCTTHTHTHTHTHTRTHTHTHTHNPPKKGLGGWQGCTWSCATGSTTSFKCKISLLKFWTKCDISSGWSLIRSTEDSMQHWLNFSFYTQATKQGQLMLCICQNVWCEQDDCCHQGN